MPVILILMKLGSVKELNIKDYDENHLYKKAGFKSDTDFRRHHQCINGISNSMEKKWPLVFTGKHPEGPVKKMNMSFHLQWIHFLLFIYMIHFLDKSIGMTFSYSPILVLLSLM